MTRIAASLDAIVVSPPMVVSVPPAVVSVLPAVVPGASVVDVLSLSSPHAATMRDKPTATAANLLLFVVLTE